MSDVFQGDPKIFLDEDGGRFEFINGQPVMDQWHENELLLSAFTPEWFGNYFFDTAEEQFSSEFLEIISHALTLETINNARDAIIKATQYLVDNGIFESISVRVFNPTGNSIQLEIRVFAIDGSVRLITLRNIGSKWVRI